jgi:preprotein translocase subunit SecE
MLLICAHATLRMTSNKAPYNLFQNQKSTNTAFYLENTTYNVANFCFLVSANVRKKWGNERKLLTVVLVVVHRVFLFSFYYFTQKV